MTGSNIASSPDFSALVGCWQNLDRGSKALLQLTLSDERGGYQLHVMAADQDEMQDWGQVAASVYARGNDPSGFHSQLYRHGLKVSIAANLTKGIIVVQTYITSLSGGSGIFSKEYFHQSSTINKGVYCDLNS